MSTLKSWPVVCFAVVLSACGGSSGGVDFTAESSDSNLRLASDAATVKPWETLTVTPVTETTLASVTPVKSAVNTPDPGSLTNTPTSTGVPTGTVSAYDPAVLPVVGGEPSASALWPAWRQSMARWQWKQIPGTDLSSVAPNTRVPGSLSARIDAWNGLAADPRTNRLYSAANGGHADYSGNEVYEIDLSQDRPAWTIIREPSAPENILASDYTKGVFYDYYLDGRPASTHTYYALNFLTSRNAIFKFGAGSLWGTGNEANWKTDAFSMDSKDWQPAGTWPDAARERGTIAAPICKDPSTDQVYLATPGNLRRFEPSSGTYSTLAAWPQNHTAVYARACAVDSARNRVVFFGDGYRAPNGGLVYDISTNSFSAFDFSGQPSAVITKSDYHFSWYEPKIGQFLLKTVSGGAVYSIDPVGFQVQEIVTAGAEAMPNAMNGVQTRWQRLPNLGGYAYYPRHGSGVWFLAIE